MVAKAVQFLGFREPLIPEARACSPNPLRIGLSLRVQGTRRVWESYVDYANRVTWEYGEGDIIVLRNNCNHDIPGRSP